MKLISTEDQPVVNRVAYQVDAGTHDEDDDADVHHGSGQGLGGPFNELQLKNALKRIVSGSPG